ncbi:hypothetical protein MesoLj113c_46300 [Mesorhizobium sp. 113-3-9]|uniref:hypothetical protein n=1 Tax=Mesorhizobium sp. 113-3-9 TaxID=2744517 RepID=UPI001926C753|nr:hypothetical protein [Mesorhizobium sp. 113-3-9]BCG88520.1 hypothetical protein MesoLj113c_46300 [Mesorhizobium sp. 113-3-9]
MGQPISPNKELAFTEIEDALKIGEIALWSRPMSRNAVLQIIAALITIALLAVLHQGLDWFLSKTSTDFMVGVMVGLVVMWLIWFYEDSRERRSRAVGRSGAAEQERARHSIDL